MDEKENVFMSPRRKSQMVGQVFDVVHLSEDKSVLFVDFNMDDFDAFKTKFLIITKFWFRSIIKRLRTGSSDTRIDVKCVYRIIEQNLLINSAA